MSPYWLKSEPAAPVPPVASRIMESPAAAMLAAKPVHARRALGSISVLPPPPPPDYCARRSSYS